MSHILVIEDEVKTAKSICEGLAAFDFKVESAQTGEEALIKLQTNRIDLIISDIILPDANGLELIQQLKKIKPNIPTIFLSALNEKEDIINGLDVGADDYLPKPFSINELIARVKALLRRYNQLNPEIEILNYDDLEFNVNQKVFKRAGKIINLSPKELDLMHYFLKNKERVISKKEIAEQVWNIHFDTGTNTIEVYVNYLRNKVDKTFEKKLIHTIHGLGYILSSEHAS